MNLARSEVYSRRRSYFWKRLGNESDFFPPGVAGRGRGEIDFCPARKQLRISERAVQQEPHHVFISSPLVFSQIVAGKLRGCRRFQRERIPDWAAR